MLLLLFCYNTVFHQTLLGECSRKSQCLSQSLSQLPSAERTVELTTGITDASGWNLAASMEGCRSMRCALLSDRCLQQEGIPPENPRLQIAAQLLLFGNKADHRFTRFVNVSVSDCQSLRD